MNSSRYLLFMISLIVALGGLLMGFDASVISGVNPFIEPEFDLDSLQRGWAVSCLTISSAITMLAVGPISDRVGRRTVLRYAAILYAISALGSAIAPNFTWFWIARMIGGFGVGASLILAPIYIAEMAPAHLRGRLVSFNQLNIVVGLSLAFFSNYLVLQLSKEDGGFWIDVLHFDQYQWRWMLGIEAVPAILYFLGLFFVPCSPRWLILKGRFNEAKAIMVRLTSPEDADEALEKIMKQGSGDTKQEKASFADLLKPALRLVLTIGIVVAVLQQITGINSVFFYSTTIFEQAGFGTDASFVQAIFVGLINLVFTVLAMLVIDRLGRKPLLTFGVVGIAFSMFLLSYAFHAGTYTLTKESLTAVAADWDPEAFNPILGQTYESEGAYKAALATVISAEQLEAHRADLLKAAISVNTSLVLLAMLGFVAAFAISLGPVMWVLFSELFPNQVRGVAISFVGLINSGVSFLVQLVFPWEVDVLGSDVTFLIYGVFAALGLVFIVRVIPETKGKSLEEIEATLVN